MNAPRPKPAVARHDAARGPVPDHPSAGASARAADAGQPGRRDREGYLDRLDDRGAELTHTGKLLLDRSAAPYETFLAIALIYLGVTAATLGVLRLVAIRFPVRA